MNNNQNEWSATQQDGTTGRTAPTLRDKRRKQKQQLLYLVQLALLTAIILVLQLTGVAIRLPIPGATNISLVLIPVALGAMLLGPIAGAFLGFVFGLVVYITGGVMHLDPFTAFLFDNNPYGEMSLHQWVPVQDDGSTSSPLVISHMKDYRQYVFHGTLYARNRMDDFILAASNYIVCYPCSSEEEAVRMAAAYIQEFDLYETSIWEYICTRYPEYTE